MSTIRSRIQHWAIEELRGSSQVNEDVLLARYKKGMLTFQKTMLEYVSGMHSTASVFNNIVKDQSEYSLPLGQTGIPDFYSIIQLRVAYKTDKNGQPLYRVCKPMNLTDYNIRPSNNIYEDGKLVEQGGRQKGAPMIWGRISERNPRYVFVDKDTIKIYPTPTENITNGIALNYNYIDSIEAVGLGTNESTLNLPRYFFDAIEDYLTFRLYQAENPEMAQWYYQQFEKTMMDNIYGMNKDKRPIEEGFANTTYFSHY